MDAPSTYCTANAFMSVQRPHVAQPPGPTIYKDYT